MSRSTAEMVRLAREARGLTQPELAETSGVPQGTISKIENDLVEPDEARITAIADALRYPVGLFAADPDTHAVMALFNRKLKTTPVPQRRVAEARVNLARLQLSRMLAGVSLESSLPFPSIDIDDIEDAAAYVRHTWRLPMGPIKNLTATVEAAGGIVSTLDFGSLKIDAASQWVPRGERPFFFLKPGIPGDRWRLSLAHEVGHMVLHAIPSPELEDEANLFAGALLMPADEIEPQLPSKINLGALFELKMHWGVSMQAIVMRGSELGVYTERQKRSFFQMINARGIRTREPGEVPLERPALLSGVIDAYLDQMGYSADDLGKVAFMRPQELLAMFAPERAARRGLRVVSHS